MNRTLFLLALLAFGRETSAQSFLYSWPTSNQKQYVLTAGDVDFDGMSDFFVVRPGTQFPPTAVGQVRIISGRTGAELLLVTNGTTEDGFATQVVALGDVDQDGRSDFAVAAPRTGSSSGPTWRPGYVRVYSGGTGSLIWEVHQSQVPSIECVRSLARVGDLSQDGVPDLVVGTWGQPGLGRAFVLSGTNGSLVLDLTTTPGASSGFGERVLSASDLDQDGFEDVLVSDRGESTSALPGRVTIHSGITGQVLLAIPMTYGDAANGLHPATLGDVSGDGIVDYALGSPWTLIVLAETYGRLRIFSGADGSELLRVDPAPGTRSFAESVDRISDHDGDGLPDVLISAGYRGPVGCCAYFRNDMRVISSVTGATLVGGQWPSATDIRAVPDADGNGFDDYGIAATQGANGVVSAVALSGATMPSVVTGCIPKLNSQGCLPRLRADGAPSPTVGSPLTLSTQHVVANTFGMTLWSPLGAVTPFAGGNLCVAVPIRRLGRSTTAAGPHYACNQGLAGTLVSTLSKSDIAAMGVPTGATFHVQTWFRDPGFAAPNDVGLSESLLVTMWP